VVLLGNRFPMIRAHKVLAAYACLVPRIVSGAFDIGHQRAVWPSTGNYCRGGAAVSRIVGCRGVAMLPAGMSAERFHWLEEWVSDPSDIVRTPGTESNVKEIYDACRVLARNPDNVILNQFSELANYLVHYQCTGAAVGRVFDSLFDSTPSTEPLQLRVVRARVRTTSITYWRGGWRARRRFLSSIPSRIHFSATAPSRTPGTRRKRSE